MAGAICHDHLTIWDALVFLLNSPSQALEENQQGFF